MSYIGVRNKELPVLYFGDRNNYVSAVELKQKGWTEYRIRKLLGEPDALAGFTFTRLFHRSREAFDRKQQTIWAATSD